MVPGRTLCNGEYASACYELLRVVRASVIRDPCGADREEMEAQQVQDTNSWQRGCRQLGMLGQHGSDKQAPIAAAVQGELPGRRHPGLLEMVGDRDKIIEDVLFVRQPTGLVPGRTELSPTAQVGDRQQSTGGKPAGPARAIVRKHWDLEPPISVQQGRLRPRPVGISGSDQEVRH